MRFVHDGREYRIAFQYDKVPVSDKAKGNDILKEHWDTDPPTREHTTAKLYRMAGVAEDGRKKWEEVMHAGVTRYHRDPRKSTEEVRRFALRSLTKYAPPKLRPLIWNAYLNRTPGNGK